MLHYISSLRLFVVDSDTLGTTLSDDELQEAIRLLDGNRSNSMDFKKVINFWVNMIRASYDNATKGK